MNASGGRIHTREHSLSCRQSESRTVIRRTLTRLWRTSTLHLPGRIDADTDRYVSRYPDLARNVAVLANLFDVHRVPSDDSSGDILQTPFDSIAMSFESSLSPTNHTAISLYPNKKVSGQKRKGLDILDQMRVRGLTNLDCNTLQLKGTQLLLNPVAVIPVQVLH